MELNAPVDIPIAELRCKREIGYRVSHGCQHDHWGTPLSGPRPGGKEKCIESVALSLKQVKELGGDTVLVVPGVVNEKVSYEQAYINSQQAIRELPPSRKRPMQIGLENVWSNFLISPVEAKRYVDGDQPPTGGLAIDVGNILRYGWPEHLIKTLNRRIMKLHAKEFSRRS